jgi:hypothetical protein
LINTATGALGAPGVQPAFFGRAAADPDGGFYYLLNPSGAGSLNTFAVNPATGDLTLQGADALGGGTVRFSVSR